MSLRNLSREVVFQDFLKTHLTRQEKSSNQEINQLSLKNILTAQERLTKLGRLIKGLNHITTSDKSTKTKKLSSLEFAETIKKTTDFLPLTHFYLISVNLEGKTIQLEFSLSDSVINKTKKTKTSKKSNETKIQKKIKINQTFLELALENENDPHLISGLSSYFSLESDKLIFQKFVQQKQLKGFIFYSPPGDLTTDRLMLESLADFWEIILKDYFL